MKHKIRNTSQSLQSSGDQPLFILFLIVLVWAPLPFGSVPQWASALLGLLVVSLSVFWMLGYGSGFYQLAPSFKEARWVHVGFIVVSLWIFLQSVSLPSGWLEALSPNAYALHHFATTVLSTPGDNALPIALDSSAAFNSFYLTITYYLFFCLTLLLVNSQQRVKLLLWVLILSGGFQALFGSLSTLSGQEVLLFAKKEIAIGVASGTYVNRNSFAGYMEMTLALGMGLLISRLSKDSASDWRERLRLFLATMMSNKVLLRSVLAVMVIGLVMSRSRMGNTAFFSSLIISGLMYVILRKQLTKGIVFLFGSLVLIDIVIVSRWFGLKKVVERIEQTSAENVVRPDVSGVTMDIIKDYPLTGSGGGSFYTVLPNYHDGTWQGFFDLAHNDFLQFALEFGLPAFAIFGLMVLMSFWQAIFAIKKRKNQLMAGLGFASFMGMLAIMIHSSVDFNLQIPANASLFVCLMALAYIARFGCSQIHSSSPRGMHASR